MGIRHIIGLRPASANEPKSLFRAATSIIVMSILTVSMSLYALTSSVSAAASPADSAETPYGSIGKWMIKSNGQIANWGGQKYQSKSIYEVVNVVIVDPTSTSASAATTKINTVMSQAGFPSRSGHSNGFKGYINNVLYGQQPTGLNAFSDNSTYAQNNHGRLFGPAAAPTGGYVWSGAFSTEKPTTFFGVLIGHAYVSFNAARDALAAGLVNSGQTQAANVDLANAYNTTTTTTGDHDGSAVVLVLQ